MTITRLNEVILKLVIFKNLFMGVPDIIRRCSHHFQVLNFVAVFFVVVFVYFFACLFSFNLPSKLMYLCMSFNIM